MPHAILRFCSINSDGYQVVSDKEALVAVTSDLQSIVFIPVGVTLS
ncbi:hypothetical protein [Anaerobiospirillum thomasii]|nr:hypothetical protein [Anaerobiospirillum thomasii]